VPPHSTTQNLRKKGRMLLSASILLLGCSSAFADAHGNSMGCCEVKRVPGSMPKSGVYYLDTEYSGSLPDVCKNSCVYNAESGPAKYCFSASSTYTAECQDSGEEELAAKVKTIQEKMESVEADIAEAETIKAAAEDISDKIGSLDMNTFITGSRLRRRDASTTYPTPADCDGLKSSMDDLADALDDIDAPTNYDTVRAASIVTMLTHLNANTLDPGCSWEEFEDLVSRWSAAKNNAEDLVARTTHLRANKKAELNDLKGELNTLFGQMTGHCQGNSSNAQCNGKDNGILCDKDCAAHHEDCRRSACCHGCCKRGNKLALLGCLPKCDFTEVVAADNTRFTISDIKTKETGIWRVVFDQSTGPDFDFDIGVANVFFSCTSSYPSPDTTECKSNREVDAGTYTVEVASGGDPWAIVPVIKYFIVGDKYFCIG